MAKAYGIRTAALAFILAGSVVCPAAAGDSLRLLQEAAPVAAAPSLLAPLPAAMNVERAMPGRLIPFEQPAADMVLQGEDDVAVFTFHLNAEQRAAGGEIRLSYLNAVSVLPDNGRMEIELNSKPVGSFAIRSPNDYSHESLSVTASDLMTGRNQLRVRARQHHRIDCSLDATYELWTRLDPAASGFQTRVETGFQTADDLLTVGRNADGFTELRLIAPSAAASRIADDSLALIQSLTLFLNRPDIRVSVVERPGEGPGIDIYVGAGSDLEQVPQAQALLAQAPTGFSVRNGERPGSAAVLLKGASRADMENGLLQAVQGPLRAGFDGGVLAAKWGTIVADASRHYTLRDAGYTTTPFAGRLSRVHFDMEMPVDFYPAEYDSVDLLLKGATAPGLRPGAQLLVRINDRAVKSYPFRDRAGEEFDGKRVPLPLRAFRPGVNRIEILAEVPVDADAACLPQERADNKPRFLLLEETALEVPALARIGRLPDLGAFAGGAYPFADGKPFDVFIDNADPKSIGAALTMVSRLALSARKPLSATLSLSAPVEREGRSALVLSAPRHQAGLAAGMKGARLAADAEEIGDGIDPMTTASAGGAVVPSAENARQLLEAFQASTASQGEGQSMSREVGDWLQQATIRFQRWLKYEDLSGAAGRPDSNLLVTLSQTRSPSGLANWTTVSAGTPGDLEAGIYRLADPAVWPSLTGGSVAIDAASLQPVAVAGGTRYIAEFSDMSFGNLRRLAAAWFSDNFQIYIVSVIGLIAVFGLWLGRVVPQSGVRTDQ